MLLKMVRLKAVGVACHVMSLVGREKVASYCGAAEGFI